MFTNIYVPHTDRQWKDDCGISRLMKVRFKWIRRLLILSPFLLLFCSILMLRIHVCTLYMPVFALMHCSHCGLESIRLSNMVNSINKQAMSHVVTHFPLSGQKVEINPWGFIHVEGKQYEHNPHSVMDWGTAPQAAWVSPAQHPIPQSSVEGLIQIICQCYSQK